jgi:hypothetical protein
MKRGFFGAKNLCLASRICGSLTFSSRVFVVSRSLVFIRLGPYPSFQNFLKDGAPLQPFSHSE